MLNLLNEVETIGWFGDGRREKRLLLAIFIDRK